MKLDQATSTKQHANKKIGMLFAAIFGLSSSILLVSPSLAVTGTPQAAWSTGMVEFYNSVNSNFTCRYIALPTISGNGLRVELSNIYGSSPLTIGAVTVALSGTGTAVTSGFTLIKFSGQTSVTIPPHSTIVSDPLNYNVTAKTELAISIHYPGSTPGFTVNKGSRTQTYCGPSGSGNLSTDTGGTGLTTVTSNVHTLKELDVYTDNPSGAIAVLGASISYGWNSTINANKRWSEVLSTRLLASSNPKSIANVGVAGTTACQAKERFNRDVLSLTGVTDVFVAALGGNDLAGGANATDTIACHQSLIDQAHAAGLRIIGSTIPPRSFDATKEGYRTTINNWIKSNTNYDGFFDFDAILKDPNNPSQINPSYNSGDNTHPGDNGSATIGNAIPLSLFGGYNMYGTYTPTYVGPGVYDDQDYFALLYNGASQGENNSLTWTRDAACGVAGCYKNTRTWSSNPNDTVTVRFFGSQIKLYAMKKDYFGMGKVSIDGGPETNIDFYSPTAVRSLVWTSPKLSVGNHTFKLRVTGEVNPSNTSGRALVQPDSVEVIAEW